MVVVIPQTMSLSDFLSFLLFLPFRPCGAVYPRNMSQCPHEDGGAIAGRGTPAFPNCVHRGALSPQCREDTRKFAHRSRKRSPKPELKPPVHSNPTDQGAKRCMGKKAVRVAGAVHSPNSAKIHARSASIISPPHAPVNVPVKRLQKGGVNLPFRV